MMTRVMMRRNLVGATSPLVLLAALTAGCQSPSSTGSTGSVGAASPGASAGATTGKTLKIAVIPKGTTHEYWKAIHAGAVKAQQELKAQGTNIDVQWKGPVREDDRNGQIDVVETFVQQQVDGIVIAPLDADAMVRPVEEAIAQKVPVVIIDSALKSDKPLSYVATDNEKGGEIGAAQLGKVLGPQKRVLLLRYQQGSASTEAREEGFLKGIKAVAGATVVSSDQYSGATVDQAFKSAQNLLNRYGHQIDGVFASNETATRGMLLALKDAGLAGKVKLVGFDYSADLIAGMKAGQIQGLVLQDPFKMGYLGVKTVVDSINGKKVEKKIDTGVTLGTPENMETKEIKDLLVPPVDQYLK